MLRRLRARGADERGAAAIIAAFIALALLATAALAVDISNAWARRGALQKQADSAALFAAGYLPATDLAGYGRVARAVAHYVACNPLPGQSEVDQDQIPDKTTTLRCDTTAAIDQPALDPDLAAYADKLIDGNPGSYGAAVTFPSSTRVAVTVPAAEVNYAFAPALPGLAGENKPGTQRSVQQKSATARVSSPGDVLPVGLSLQCIAQAVDAAGLGAQQENVLPLNYITPGSAAGFTTTAESDELVALGGWTAPYVATNASPSVLVSDPAVTGTNLALTVRVNNAALLPALNLSLRLVYGQGKEGVRTITAEQNLPLVTVLPNLNTPVIVPLPAGVTGSPGYWHVKVQLNVGTTLSPVARWSDLDAIFTINPSDDSILDQVGSALEGITDLDQSLACARLTDSPRPEDGGSPTLTFNIQEGGDHALTSNPGLASVLAGMSLEPALNGSASSLLAQITNLTSNPSAGLTGCLEAGGDHLDTEPNYDNGVVADCGHVRSDAQVEQEFTDGFLKDTGGSATTPGYGRLHCNRALACSGPGTHTTASVALPGFSGTYNNDSFKDFVPGPTSALDSQVAYSLDTYLLPGVPLITPNNKVSTDIYGSPRFFWAPVLTYLDLEGSAADYPILTFRPMFIDNGVSDNLPIAGINPADVVDDLPGFVLDTVTTICSSLFAAAPLSFLVCSAATVTLTTAITALGPTPDADDILGLIKTVFTAIDPDFKAGEEIAGLLIQDTKLKAVRFMTIAPDALPPLTASYTGPTTDYLGVGPKIIRLVE